EFTDALGELKIPALDLAAQYKEMGEAIRGKINEEFKTWGLEVTKFFIENISVPPEVEAALDKRASMGALGDAQRYMQFQAADALRDAAQNEGGARQEKQKCAYCQAELAPGAKFCPECGTKSEQPA